MALKRVSDLAKRTYSDIKEKINDIYGSDNTKSIILPTSKIEVSETQNSDASLFRSYSYDLNALSGIFTDQIFHRDVSFEGDKIFNDDVIINGSLSVISDNFSSNTDVFISKKQVNIQSTNDISLNSKNKSTNINSGNEINLDSRNNININSTNGHVKVETPKDISLKSDNTTITSNRDINLIYKDNLIIIFKDSNGDNIPVLTFGHNGNTPTVSFNVDVITQENPVDGVINRALWN